MVVPLLPLPFLLLRWSYNGPQPPQPQPQPPRHHLPIILLVVPLSIPLDITTKRPCPFIILTWQRRTTKTRRQRRPQSYHHHHDECPANPGVYHDWICPPDDSFVMMMMMSTRLTFRIVLITATVPPQRSFYHFPPLYPRVNVDNNDDHGPQYERPSWGNTAAKTTTQHSPVIQCPRRRFGHAPLLLETTRHDHSHVTSGRRTIHGIRLGDTTLGRCAQYNNAAVAATPQCQCLDGTLDHADQGLDRPIP